MIHLKTLGVSVHERSRSRSLIAFFKSLQRVWHSGALHGFTLSLLTICSHTVIIHRTESWEDARGETQGLTIKLKTQTLQCFILQSVCIFTFLFSCLFFLKQSTLTVSQLKAYMRQHLMKKQSTFQIDLMRHFPKMLQFELASLRIVSRLL